MKLQLFGKDKYIHFGVCLAIAYVARVVFGWMSVPVIVAALIGFCCAMCTGIGKEYGDKLAPGNKWDWYDIIADALGALIGCFGGIIPVIIFALNYLVIRYYTKLQAHCTGKLKN